MSPVTLVTGPPRSAYSIGGRFYNYSEFTTVTVVPEPMALTSLMALSLLLCCRGADPILPDVTGPNRRLRLWDSSEASRGIVVCL